MSKCIVCSKSAGPFHSLHKACLPVYQNTRKCLENKFSDCIASADSSSDVVVTIQSCNPSKQFSVTLFKVLVSKAWFKQAELVIKDSSLNLAATKVLLRIADGFGINNQDIDDYLLVRLSNVEQLQRLQNNQPIDKCFEDISEEIELEQHEAIVWKFSDTARTEQQRYSQEKQWTVFSTVLSNIMMKKRYKELAVKIEESGTLLVTNQGLHYKNNKTILQTKFSEIHSITPMKNGVRIQANLRGAMPDTYVTGDGRFTYALLQYAQGLDD